MKTFIVLSESPLKVRKIAVYRFLISFLVPELLRFKVQMKCFFIAEFERAAKISRHLPFLNISSSSRVIKVGAIPVFSILLFSQLTQHVGC